MKTLFAFAGTGLLIVAVFFTLFLMALVSVIILLIEKSKSKQATEQPDESYTCGYLLPG